MDNLSWYWVYTPNLDRPNRQHESALKAGYNKVYFKDNVDAQIRQFKRALWMARAERAVAEQTVDEWSRYKEKHPFGSWRVDPFEYWVQAWICVEKICRKKAEAYK